MRSMGDPDYEYKPWSDERRKRASIAAKKRLQRPAQITVGQWQRLLLRLATIEKQIDRIRT